MPTEQKSRRATFRAAARSTTGYKRKGSINRNLPGYRAPGKIGTKLVGAHAPVAIHEAFQRAAAAENKTVTALLLEFVTAKAKNFMTPNKKQERVKPTPPRTPATYSEQGVSLGLA